jgi:hypothetical protein
MHVRQSILGEIGTRSGQTITSVDVGALVRRLILFDKVILKSFRLREAPFLARTFGTAGFSTLLKSGLLQFSCNFNSIITDLSRDGVRHLPIQHFSFARAYAANPDVDLRAELRCLQGITSLKNLERYSLEEAIWDSLAREPVTYGDDLLKQIDSDFRSNTPALRAAVVGKLQAELDPNQLKAADIIMSVEETATRVFRIKNNLSDSFGFSPEKSHAILQGAVSAVANLDQRLADMQAHSAITGFLDAEAPILFGKLAGVLSPMNPRIAEGQFERVIELAEVPDFKPGQKVNVELLIKVRDSAECREFREWLATLGDVTDNVIKEMVASIKSKIAQLAGSTSGKFVRLATTTGIGLIPGVGLAAGIAASAIDSFLVDRVLPKSGVVAFLTDAYPSLFVSS